MIPVISVSGGTTIEDGSSLNLLEFTVTLSEPSLQAVTVNFRTLSAFPSFDTEDFAGQTDTLTFAPGVTSQVISITESFDRIDETDEAVTIELFDPVNAELAGDTATLRETGFILDDDGSNTDRALFVSSPVIVENDNGTRTAVFTIDLSEPFGSSTSLNFTTIDGSATAGDDYQETSGVVTFGAGVTSQSVNVPIFGDTDIEGSEFFHLSVTPNAQIASGAVGSVGTATLLDDDAGGALPTISVEGISTIEDGSALAQLRYVVTLSEPSLQEVTVNFRTLSAFPSFDTEDFAGQTDTLTFAPGVTSQVIGITESFDRIDETDEAVTIELFDPVNAELAGDTATLRETAFIFDDGDDGVGPNQALFVSSPVIVEGDSGTRQAVFEIELSQPLASAITLAFTTLDGSAVAGQDYTATSGDITFAAGQTRTSVTVDLNPDTDIEGSEFFHLSVTPNAQIASGAVGSVGTATLLDDDAGGALPTISVEGISTIEDGSALAQLRYVVTLSEPSLQEVTVEFETVGGTATGGVDYTSRSGILTFAPGVTSQVIGVTERFDRIDEADESVVLRLTRPDNAVFANGVGRLEEVAFIFDSNDDGTGPNQALFVSSPLLVEGATDQQRFAVFDVELSQPSDTELSIDFSTVDGSAIAGQDYVAQDSTLVFAPGQTRASVLVEIIDDIELEGTETFSLSFDTPLPLNFAGGNQGINGTATIFDNEIVGDEFSNTLEGTAFSEGIYGLESNDTLFGRGGDDFLFGGAGADTLNGEAGDDVLSGFFGPDRLNGGDGIDTADYSAANAAIRVSLQAGVGFGSEAQGDRFTSVENLTGTRFGDLLVGDGGNNRLEGAFGDDNLIALAGNDVLVGAGGNDIVNGGFGNDFGSGGNGNDTLFGGNDNDFLRGDGGDDFLNGNNADDQLFGGAGADDVFGAGGSDTVFGGGGNDTVNGGNRDDTVSGDAGNDTVLGGGGSDALFGGTGNDSLLGSFGFDTLDGGAGVDRLNGGVGQDLLLGGADNDVLIGFDGNDTLDGGTGNDVLIGGGGVDRFLFDDASFGTDTILDLTEFDVIDLSALGVSFGDLSISSSTNATVVTLANGTIRLVGVDQSTIDQNDFDFIV